MIEAPDRAEALEVASAYRAGPVSSKSGRIWAVHPDARLQALLRQVILRSFSELRRLRIGIAFEDLAPGDFLEYYTLRGRFRIAVSPLLRGAPRRALEGGIAHELSHILQDHRLGPAQLESAFARSASSRTYRIREERAADRHAVERGYGPHLIALVRFARRLGIRFYRENGLVAAEIVNLHKRLWAKAAYLG
jgi:hypothetical protein